MGYIIGGFILVVLIETLIRVLSTHERIPKKKQGKVQVSLPWYGWSLAGLITYGIFRKKQ